MIFDPGLTQSVIPPIITYARNTDAYDGHLCACWLASKMRQVSRRSSKQGSLLDKRDAPLHPISSSLFSTSRLVGSSDRSTAVNGASWEREREGVQTYRTPCSVLFHRMTEEGLYPLNIPSTLVKTVSPKPKWRLRR